MHLRYNVHVQGILIWTEEATKSAKEEQKDM